MSKPIPLPTEYRGTTFRSKLEATWALNLDEKKIAWVYEPECFLLPSGARYLPDFWLPSLNSWLEVKGPGVSGLQKTREFAEVLGGTPNSDWGFMSSAVVVGGPPLNQQWNLQALCRYCFDPIKKVWIAGHLHCSGPSWNTYCNEGDCCMESRCYHCNDKFSPRGLLVANFNWKPFPQWMPK